VAAALEQTRAANRMVTDAHARLMVTRGRKVRPFQHPKLSRFGPTMVIIMEHSQPAPSLARGVRLATVPQVRGLPMSQDPKLNSHSKLNCVLACIQAENAGADEALMLDPHGFVNTTNACNFFIVRKGEVWTSTGDYCMNGITRAKVLGLCRANGMTADVHARLMITRGIKAKPFQDPRLSRTGPTMVIIMEHSAASDETFRRGIRLHTVPFHRGLPLTQDPKLNSHSKLNCILAGIHAQKAGADEALMLDPQGFVNTTNSCNFFIVRRGEVWTSTGDYCMPGITRSNVIRLCRANAIPVFEKNFSLVETYGAGEAFITGTFGAQTPVVEIDGRHIGDGPGPVTARIWDLYKALVAADTK
jgi:branched-chain amino acid aminotransferase